MKVNLDIAKTESLKTNKVSFGGYKFTKSDYGYKQFEVSYPYDPDKDDCYLEVYKLAKDPYGNYYTTGRAYTNDAEGSVKLNPGKNRIDLANTFGFDSNQDFAYHYLLVDKHGNDFPRVRIDAGDVIDERSYMNENRNIFNVVSANRSTSSRGGSMKLVIIDSQHVGRVYNSNNKVDFDKKLAKRAQEGVRSLTNKFGGTLAGLEYGLDNGEYDAYGRIISLPIFTDDDFTSHAYWNKNCMQMASSLGNINNYASFQRKMFAHGLNFVSDGAFVNEGLDGVHFKHILKWGDESPYLNWFRASSIKDGPLSMGVFAKNKECISHKIVNSPYSYTQRYDGHISISKNYKYDKTKPTYIQFFDKRLVTREEKNDTENLIKSYSAMGTDNVYDLHSHNDSIYPYSFEINPETYNDNIKNLNKYNSKHTTRAIMLDDYKAARLLSKNEAFIVDGKFESGFETWDANPDIAKLNFVYSNADSLYLKNFEPSQRTIEKEKILMGNAQVQDYVVQSGKYWTEKTDDILRLYIAQNLKNIDSENPTKVYKHILSLSNNKIFPSMVKSEISKSEVENVLFGMYSAKRKLDQGDKKSQILKGLMDLPLDSLEFGDNIVSVLASPLVSKRAVKAEDIGLSRYEVYKNGNKNLPMEYERTYNMMDSIYTNQLYTFAQNILSNVDDNLPEESKLFDRSGEVTEFGKYVLPILTSEIARYAIIKSLAPAISLSVDRQSGEIAYDYKRLKHITLQSLGIQNPPSVEDETIMLLEKIEDGISTLDASSKSPIVESLTKKLKGTNALSFKLADLIIDKTQSGLDWRIDATKDIADVEALRNGNTDFEYTWQAITNFWKRFSQGVLSQNPNAYLVAEVTNKEELHDKGSGWGSKKYNDVHNHAVQKFLRETGITSIAEYSYWFRDISKMFGADFEDGSKFTDSAYRERLIFEKMMQFINMGSLDSVRYAYTFIGNHDKPRALHCLAMDMGLFYADLMDNNNAEQFEYRRKAYQVIKDKYLEEIKDSEVNLYDFSAVSAKAVAMADAIRPAFINTLNNYRHEYPAQFGSEENFNRAFIAISKSISDLAQGRFKDINFDPDSFGVKPFDVAISMVMKQAKSEYGLSLPKNVERKYEDAVFEAIMDPAMSKLLGMMKVLVALPGIPTMFDGDDYATSGYDTKTKNMYLQGRQRNHDEWVDVDNSKYKSFVERYKKHLDDVMKVRKNPRCNALNNGSIHTMPLNYTQTGEAVASILRQSTDGRMAISIFNSTGLHNDFRKHYSQNNVYLDRLYFDENGESTVGIAGLKEGTKFVNSKNAKDVYYTRVENGRYYLTRHVDGKDVPTPLHDTTLILYHVPEKNPALTFTGNIVHKPKADFIANVYTKKNENFGKQLSLVK